MSFGRRYVAGVPEVIVVGSGDGPRHLEQLLSNSLEEYSVTAVDSVAAALTALEEATSCLVLTPECTDDRDDLTDALADRDRAPPVVLVPNRIDESVALATTEGVAAIVPPGYHDELPEVVAKEAEAYLERLGDDLQLRAVETLFDAIEDVFQIKDADGRYLRLLSNREWPSESEVLGRTDRVLHDDQFGLNESYFAEDRSVLESGEPILGDITGYGDGPLFWIETTKVPLQYDDGEIRGLVGHVRDVSERMEQRQALEQQNQRLDRFASYVSHDLQNPLSIATGYLDLAREGDDAALDTVEDSIDRMQQLVDDIAILARGDEQTLHAGPEGTLVAIQQRIVEIARNVWSVLSTDAATLEIDLPESTVVYAGEQEFRSMLENLLKNAIDHGGEDVTVRIGATSDGFYVEDDGPGVPAEERDQIFEQGYSTANGGTGTGLAIVSTVAAGYDWTIEVTEGNTGGARFELGNCLLVTDLDVPQTSGEPVAITDSTDVGEPGTTGSATYDEVSDAWTLSGSGEDIWGRENDFHFASATLSGDCRLEARLTDMVNANEFSKAGIMLRGDLEEDSRHGYVGLNREQIEVLWCTEAAEPTTSQHLGDDDQSYQWLRIDRGGDVLTLSISADGREWFPIDQRSIPFEDPIHAGLAVCSAVHRETTQATFEGVSLQRFDGT